ncbi:hypothetical protein J1N35_027047 [Gossypium stocksii]|uniref:Uncharacterized protein n=1 Tax=Gossypium stocksii TaxID=47602 RepID=A0A9D3ZZD4_9ROSI|nr:hypothetical protein J1N35_027047 [Gossypium stocksii]
MEVGSPNWDGELEVVKSDGEEIAKAVIWRWDDNWLGISRELILSSLFLKKKWPRDMDDLGRLRVEVMVVLIMIHRERSDKAHPKVGENDDVDTTVKKESDNEETNTKEEDDAPKKSSNKNTSKKIAMDRPDSKLKDTSASGKKLTSAKSSRKSSGSTSKQGASDGDRTPGSKLKDSASKKQKVGKEGSNDVKFSTKNEVPGKKQTNKSPAKVSTKTQR